MKYFELYPADYLAKTAHLSLAEHGAYMLMLMTFYSAEKPLPTNRKVLYRLLRADTSAERAAIDAVVAEFWTETTEGLTNGRCEEVVTEYRSWVSKQKANGVLGGRPRPSQIKPNANPKITHGLSQTEPIANPTGNPNETQREPNGGDKTYSQDLLTTHTHSESDVLPRELSRLRERIQANGKRPKGENRVCVDFENNPEKTDANR